MLQSEVNQNATPPRVGVTPPFQKGQVWLMGDKAMLIQHMGKRLVQFKIFHTDERLQGRRRAPSSLETVTIVQNYLNSHNAVLQAPAVGKPA